MSHEYIDYPLTPSVIPIGSIICRQLLPEIAGLELNEVTYLLATEVVRITNPNAWTEPINPLDPKVPIPAITALVLAHTGTEFNLYSIAELKTLHYSLQTGDFGAFAGVADDQFTLDILPQLPSSPWPPLP